MTGRDPGRSPWAALWPWAPLIALLAIGWVAYRPALSGTFLLDDYGNLDGLRAVTDARSAIHFVLTGDSGPLGRPLALASFLPQASAWAQSAAPFLQVNILIHLLNGFLMFLLARQLAQAVLRDRQDAQAIALGTTAVWLFMPLLASSTLLIVQRMTTLSATFVLCGLNGYIAARQHLDPEPRAALIGMSLALAICTLLAVFTKENGVLLPTLVLVVEATLLRPPVSLSARWWNAWRGLFLVAPSLLVIAFLVAQVPYPDDLVARREFTAVARLASEARILWEYLLHAFFAPGADLGPFHEARKASSLFSDLGATAAVVAWITVVLAAAQWRHRYPVAAFAVFWFLAGHLLESTTVPLELYFEHRNYVPIIGPVFALCFLLLRVPRRYRVISGAALTVYAVVNVGILFGVTSMWGNPLLAASLWHSQDPASVRAATTLASQQLSSLGPEPAIDTLREFAEASPRHAYIRIPELNLVCVTAPGQDHSDLVEYLETSLPSAAYSLTAGEMLDQLLTTSLSDSCDSVRPGTVAVLASALMKNPRYSGSSRYTQFHHMLMARIARAAGDSAATLDHLAIAVEIRPGDDLNLMTVMTLVEENRFDAARNFISEARRSLSLQPLRRYNSSRYLDDLLSYVDEAERLHQDRNVAGNGD